MQCSIYISDIKQIQFLLKKGHIILILELTLVSPLKNTLPNQKQ